MTALAPRSPTDRHSFCFGLPSIPPVDSASITMIADLPKAQTDQYNEHQKRAFLEAFNSAYDEYGGDEHRAFAVAHAAAKRAGERPGPG